jgi:hypothetical protein
MHCNAMVRESGVWNLWESSLGHMTSGAVVSRSALLFRKAAACIGMARKAFGPKESGAGG